MNNTVNVRTSTWGKTIKQMLLALTLLVTLVPATVLLVVEWFVDPYPNSIWALRILNTKYLVHVRADLTIDGEPLVMERTVRCFHHVDFGFLNRWNKHTFVTDGQAGDTIAAATAKGRLFAITDLNVCHTLVDSFNAYKPGHDEAISNNAAPLRLSKRQIEIPRVYEIHGGYEATRVDSYFSRNLIQKGYHGVQLIELLIENQPLPPSPWNFAKDWNGYDWFGHNNWVRPFIVGKTRGYTAGYILRVPYDIWSTTPIVPASQNPKYYEEDHKRYRAALSSYSEDGLILGEKEKKEPKYLFGWTRTFISYGLNGILLRRAEQVAGDLDLQQPWLKNNTIPCLGSRWDGHICQAVPELAGVMIYTRTPPARPRMGNDTEPLFWYYYHFDGKELAVRYPLPALYYRASDRTAFVMDFVDTQLGSD